MLDALLRTALPGSAVTLAWLAADRLFGKRLPAAWHYRILKLALALFLVPVWPLAAWAASVTPAPAPAVPSVPAPGPMIPVIQAPAPPAEAAPVPAAPAAVSVPIDALQILTAVWAAVAVAMLGYRLWAYGRFRREVLCQSRPVSGGDVPALLEECRAHLGLRRPVALLENPAVETPLSTGLLRPAIVLPAGESIRREELRYVFLHELTHIKRGDLWVRLLAMLAAAVHWYDPLAYILKRGIRRVSEQNCDELVAGPLSGGQRFAYGSMLLRLAAEGGAYPQEWAAPLSARDTVERRLYSVLHPEKLKGRRRLLALGLALVIAVCGATAALAAQTPLVEGKALPPTGGQNSPTVEALTVPPAEETAEAAVWFGPEDIRDLAAAELTWWDGTVLPLPEEKLGDLEALLSAGKKIVGVGCPFHSVLSLRRTDGTVGKVLFAEDSCGVFQSGESCYETPEDSDRFYALFGVVVEDLPHYTTARAGLKALRDSVCWENGSVRFTLPPDDLTWSIHIAGRSTAADGMSVHYLEDAAWVPGQSYSFPAPLEYAELTMDAAADGETASIDLLACRRNALILSWPVQGDNQTVSSGFGKRWNPGGETYIFHDCVDIAAPTGEVILAAADGTVSETGYDPVRGNYVILDHGGGITTVYAACRNLAVKTGDTVERGGMVAAVGSTGQSTGPHLCFQVLKDGQAQDPMGWFGEAKAAVAAAAPESQDGDAPELEAAPQDGNTREPKTFTLSDGTTVTLGAGNKPA